MALSLPRQPSLLLHPPPRPAGMLPAGGSPGLLESVALEKLAPRAFSAQNPAIVSSGFFFETGSTFCAWVG